MANPHALVVPASGQGHVNGSLQLASALVPIGFHVHFVYFSSEYATLQARKRLVLPDSVLAAGSTPATSFTTGENGRGSICIHVLDDDYAPSNIHKIFAMKENLFNLILELREQGTPPTCLISDTFLTWTLHVAERAGIPRIDYCTTNALSYILTYSAPLLFSRGIFPEKGSLTQWKRETPLMLDHIPGMPPLSSELYGNVIRFTDASHPTVSFCNEVSSCAKNVERILIHTMSELEPDAFQAFKALGLSAYAIGPLLHHTKKQEGSTASSQAKEKLGEHSVSQLNEEVDGISWLNMQEKSSVIYVAFGSIASFSVEEIQELAFGLEASGNPFLWVIRKDSHDGAELPQVLSDGFLERISAKGMIISWAPQMEVLAHKAVGGFLTHCGWNSTLESLWEGVPMLSCPLMYDQRVNSRYICDVWGVGLELGRTETGSIERRYVELGVKALMQEEEGLRARGKAQEVMQLARKTCQKEGQSYSNLQKFYEDMKILCSKPSSE